MEALEPKILAEVDEKGFVPDEVRNAFFRKLRLKSENRSCFECTARNPTWISLSYGVYLCLECSGEHRRKGVHISFVRSVELDRFSPEQMVQMACGGNGKAWEYFKQSGMGKTSDGGRMVDYHSKIAQRYKQQIEKDAATACDKFGVVCKVPGKAAPSAPVLTSLVDPVDEAADFVGPSASAKAPPAAAPPQAAKAKAAPAAASPASTVKVLRPNSDSSPQVAGMAKPTSPTAFASSAVKPAGFAAKQKAKEIDFDFDFDELETEASKPAPVAAPTPKSPAARSSPAAAAGASDATAKFPERKPPAVRSSPAAASPDATAKFAERKAISSDDFFQQVEGESASQRVERESRYHKFAGAGAISSSSFFGNADATDDMNNMQHGEGMDDWKAVASVAASRGSEMAKAGISRGAELFTTYLNKVRD